ncbi:MAG TPA: methylaspartate mutase accessory protein GlmL [Candidatus Binatia bacterium]
MSSLAILIDFGSTFTKVCAVDLASARLLGRSQSPSTVHSDVREGLLRALVSLHERHRVFDQTPTNLSLLNDKFVLASSSAAGGLRIVVVGNVPGLTVEAANQAALGAGAKVVGATAFKLSEAKLMALEALRPDMILLTGGVDGGDAETITHNARLLAHSSLSVPMVVAGNGAAADAVVSLLQRGGKEVCSVANVMPGAGKLNVEPAREAIREIFMARITHAKGLDGLAGAVPVVLPTPMAVLHGVRLGAEGTAGEGGWGDMLVVDVGGATTDVHSIGEGQPGGENVIVQSMAEAYAKRTVEGDLGIRYNAGTILERVGEDSLRQDLQGNFGRIAVTAAMLRGYVEQLGRDTSTLPQADWHSAADAVLARAAVDIAIARHVGRRERIVAREGEAWLHYGKDMRDTRTLIGTGGVFVHNAHAAFILDPREQADVHVEALRPRQPKMFVDASYLLYAVGLLAAEYPAVGLRLFQQSMKPVG